MVGNYMIATEFKRTVRMQNNSYNKLLQ